MHIVARILAVVLGCFAARGAFSSLSGDGWMFLAQLFGVPLAGGIVYAAAVTVGDQLIPSRHRP